MIISYTDVGCWLSVFCSQSHGCQLSVAGCQILAVTGVGGVLAVSALLSVERGVFFVASTVACAVVTVLLGAQLSAVHVVGGVSVEGVSVFASPFFSSFLFHRSLSFWIPSFPDALISFAIRANPCLRDSGILSYCPWIRFINGNINK